MEIVKMEHMITDFQGRRTIIKDNEVYTIIYSTLAKPFHREVVSGLFHKNDSDLFIGKWIGSYNDSMIKVYFDNNVPDEGNALKLIHAVYTDAQWQDILDKIINY